jgi:hypothetical protein
MKKILFFALLSVIMFSCKENGSLNDVLDNQTNEIYIKTKDILDDLGFSGYSIKVYPHKSIGNVPSSRTVNQ